MTVKIDKKPVILLAVRRGGSTWVAESIAAQMGVWYVNEPFAVFPQHENYAVKKSYLPIKEHSQYFDLKGQELTQFSDYIDKLLSVEIRPLGACKNTAFPLKVDRVLLKVLNAPWMLNWFLNETQAQLIFLTRHPGSQALSVLRQGWGFGVEAYFNQSKSIHTAFTDKQVNFGYDIIKRNNKWDMAILDWVVLTHHGRSCDDKNLIKLAYEEVIADQALFLQNILENKLSYSNAEKTKTALRTPSGSSAMSTKSTIDLIKDGGKATLLSKWRDKITLDELKSASAILEKFEVDTYSMYEDMPLKSFLSEA